MVSQKIEVELFLTVVGYCLELGLGYVVWGGTAGLAADVYRDVFAEDKEQNQIRSFFFSAVIFEKRDAQ